jgi:hypothetical protein
MIDTIYSNSSYLTVVGGTPGNPYISSGGQCAGMIRWNVNTSVQEIYNGVAWIEYRGGNVNIDLNQQGQKIMRWAEERMRREEEIKALAEQYVAVKDALEASEKAQEYLDIVAGLVTGRK